MLKPEKILNYFSIKDFLLSIDETRTKYKFSSFIDYKPKYCTYINRPIYDV